MAQQTLINGNRYSFANITIQLGGVEVARGALKSINYDASQEPGLVQGNQVAPVGRTVGYGSATGSFEMLASEWDDFNDSLTNSGETPTMSVDFDIIISYSVNDVDVRTDSLLGCRITKIGSANTQGNDATTKACDLSIMQVYENGILAYGDPSA